MPNIYLTQAEMDAIDFFQGVTMNAVEGGVCDEFQKEYDDHSNHYGNLTRKFLTSKSKADNKATVNRVLKEIKENKQ